MILQVGNTTKTAATFFYNFKSLIVFDESRQFLAHSNVGKDDSEGS